MTTYIEPNKYTKAIRKFLDNRDQHEAAQVIDSLNLTEEEAKIIYIAIKTLVKIPEPV